jgi:hypothetical protein
MKPILVIFLQLTVAAVLITSAACAIPIPTTPRRFLSQTLQLSQQRLGPGCTTNFFKELFSDKYTIQEYQVPTSDGYILTLFRVGLTPTESAKLPKELKKNIARVIHFQHGLMDSSDGIFWSGQASSIGFH